MEWINNSRTKLKLGNMSIALVSLIGILMASLGVSTLYIGLTGKTGSPRGDFIGTTAEPLPTKTNSWFSSAYSFPTRPIYVHPLVVEFNESGMGFSYPEVITADKVVSASYQRHCTIGFDDFDHKLDKVTVKSYGDWHVSLEVGGNNSVTLAKGSPFVYIKAKNIVLECVGNEVVIDEGSVVATVSGRRYLVQAQNSLVSSKSGNAMKLSSFTGVFRIAPLFGNTSEEILKGADWFTPTKTEVKWQLDDGFFITEYIQKGAAENTLMVLYPHQYNYLTEQLNDLGSYETALGQLKVFRGNKFSTKVPVPDLKANFTGVENKDYRNQISEAVNEDIKKFSEYDFPDGVYSKGTMLGALSTLVQLTAIYSPERLNEVLGILERELANLLSEFEYSAQKTMLIAKNPEFGNEEGNDHHFHYGYYIRAAAVLENYKPGALGEDKKAIDEMVADIASLEPGKYPRLRSFSVYEGHSWAAGYAEFADGNNQESTSEALNAWYAIALWGQLNKDTKLSELGLWLYSQELVGANTYWFGANNPFPQGYGRKMASIVWGGKRDFATWFSAEPIHIYGIQLLPITPASTYHFDKIITDRQVEEMETLSPAPQAYKWGDLYVSYLAFLDPEKSVNLLKSVSSTEGMKLKSLLLQTVFERLEKAEKEATTLP